MKKYQGLFLLGFGFFFQACASLVQGGEDPNSVEVVDRVESYRCKYLGFVTGMATSAWDSAQNLVEEAVMEGKRSAAEKQANQVTLQGAPQIVYNSDAKQREATVTLNAYQCKK